MARPPRTIPIFIVRCLLRWLRNSRPRERIGANGNRMSETLTYLHLLNGFRNEFTALSQKRSAPPGMAESYRWLAVRSNAILPPTMV